MGINILVLRPLLLFKFATVYNQHFTLNVKRVMVFLMMMTTKMMAMVLAVVSNQTHILCNKINVRFGLFWKNYNWKFQQQQ